MLANRRTQAALIPVLLSSCLAMIAGCADSDAQGPAKPSLPRLRSLYPARPVPHVDVPRVASPRLEVSVGGVARPQVVPGDQAPVPDRAVVIGVNVGSVARAYVVKAFEVRDLDPAKAARDPEAAKVLGRHVVNDVVDGTPISVTHCDRNRCTRVLTDSDAADALDIGVGGWEDGMLLLIDGERVSQAAEEVPYEDVPFEVTTWKQWREEHPHTDVYVGG